MPSWGVAICINNMHVNLCWLKVEERLTYQLFYLWEVLTCWMHRAVCLNYWHTARKPTHTPPDMPQEVSSKSRTDYGRHTVLHRAMTTWKSISHKVTDTSSRIRFLQKNVHASVCVFLYDLTFWEVNSSVSLLFSSWRRVSSCSWLWRRSCSSLVLLPLHSTGGVVWGEGEELSVLRPNLPEPIMSRRVGRLGRNEELLLRPKSNVNGEPMESGGERSEGGITIDTVPSDTVTAVFLHFSACFYKNIDFVS